MYHNLPKSYKDIYPFKLGTTSFIYPDYYIPNVKMLAPYMDEIELLLFESAKECLPSKHEIKTLALLTEEFDTSYNIHLPTDIFLGNPNPSIRHHAVETIIRIIDLTSLLSPSTYTLHLSYDEPSWQKDDVIRWQDLICESMMHLLSAGIKAESISIETLMYPFEWADKIINEFNLSVCIDLGHLILKGTDLEAIFEKYCGITSILHIHGVEKSQDHVSLDKLSEKHIGSVMRILKRFTGIVSLEVFSFNNLVASLDFLEKCWQIDEKDAGKSFID